jgi:hypothetical protein
MTTAEVAAGCRPSSGWKGSTRGAAWVVLLVFVLSGRGVWSSWYAMPCMPALWLEHRVTDGLASFAWCYSGAGAVLCGPGSGDLWSSFAPWERRLPAFAGLVVASAAGAFIESGVHGEFGVSAGFGLVLFVSIAVFVWAREAAAALGPEGEAGRPTSGCS